MKKDKHRTRITVGRNNTKYEGDDETSSDHLETEKNIFNSSLSRQNAKVVTIDISNFYLMVPMDNCEYLRMNVKTFPSKIIKDHN